MTVNSGKDTRMRVGEDLKKKKAYSSPQLYDYGSVLQATASGSKGVAESTMMGMGMGQDKKVRT